ncbi:MAG: DNA repair protein RecO [Desulfonatronovibrionaceae bacterium]
MEFVENCLVLRTGGFRESDAWLRLLSPRYGVFTAFAFGGRRSRKRFCGCLDTLNHVRFRVRHERRKDYYVLQEGSLLRGFSGLKRDSARMGIAANCLRFLDCVHIYPEDAPYVHEVFARSLAALEDNPGPSSFFPLVFKVAVVFSLGFSPDISCCAGCGLSLDRIDHPGFDVPGGRVFCSRCRLRVRGVVSADRSALNFLHQINSTGPEQWVVWSPERLVRQNCLRLVDAFVNYHLRPDRSVDF